MTGIGELLRTTREEKGVSLDEICQKTNLRKDYILAIEAEEFEKLPTLIHGKGFVKSYAQFLGLDADEAVKHFSSAEKHFKDRENLKPSYVQEGAKPKVTWSEFQNEFLEYLRLNRDKIVFIISGTIVLIAIYYSALFVYEKSKTLWTNYRSKITDVFQKDESDKKKDADLSQDQILAESENRVTPKDTKRTEVPAFLDLEIESRERVWVSVKADGDLVFEGVLDKGMNELWRAEEYLDIKVSDPSMVEMTVNQKYIEEFSTGQSRQVRVTPKGIEFK